MPNKWYFSPNPLSFTWVWLLITGLSSVHCSGNGCFQWALCVILLEPVATPGKSSSPGKAGTQEGEPEHTALDKCLVASYPLSSSWPKEAMWLGPLSTDGKYTQLLVGGRAKSPSRGVSSGKDEALGKNSANLLQKIEKNKRE